MDGLSYWIFLAVFYLLSALMKKRREQVSDSSTEKNPNIFQNKFFQDLFQDMKEVEVDYEEPPLEEFENSFDEEEKHLEKENIVFEDISTLSNEEEHKKNKPKNQHDIKKQIQVNFFKSSNDLKRGIIMKEILDKPRALRKNIF
jgi:hypothetical protein|tara:strand:+ start:222 stop:653 length:432 start_codon:yes stop_codon:yes gene_type:complete